MRKILVFTISLMANFICAQAQQNLSADQKAVQETVIAMFDGLAKKDTAAMKLQCTKDMLLLEDKEVWTLDSLTTMVGRNNDTSYKRVNRMDFIETKIEGRMAWTSYYNQANISRRGKQILVRWLETAILIKVDKKWKMRVLHSTTIERK